MELLREMLKSCLDQDLAQMIISNPRSAGGIGKIKIRPVRVKGNLMFQSSEYQEKKVYHQNLSAEQMKEQILCWMQEFKQLEAAHPLGNVHVLVSKKGKVTIKRTKGCARQTEQDLSHNRSKKYILDPDTRVPFLVDLGVQTKEGKIVHAKYDKFRQINRFLEFIQDVIPKLPRDREVVIVDFGCGKSYLTFAMYYYLHELKGYDIRIIGLDLKEDVIKNCQTLADAYGYGKLTFVLGDIADYEGVDQVDMVVTLHACDTATDYALDKAVRWGAKVILSVPCCQHELNGQIKNELLEPVLKYGLLRERLSAILTDAVRAGLLESAGYQVQILEFIDMEHTPKNLLIRAVKGGQKKPRKPVEDVMAFFHVDPTLAALQKEDEDA